MQLNCVGMGVGMGVERNLCGKKKCGVVLYYDNVLTWYIMGVLWVCYGWWFINYNNGIAKPCNRALQPMEVTIQYWKQ